jgi:hypothetical protein
MVSTSVFPFLRITGTVLREMVFPMSYVDIDPVLLT